MVDTSAWIEFFRKGEGRVCRYLDSLLDEDRVALCGIIEMELLWGVRPKERARLKTLIQALHYIEILREDYIKSGETLCRLREKGITIPSTDALVARVCIRLKLPLLSLDRHFKYIGGLAKINS